MSLSMKVPMTCQPSRAARVVQSSRWRSTPRRSPSRASLLRQEIAARGRPSHCATPRVYNGERDLLIALNSGLPGMCTLHANSAREAILKMCTLPLLAGENVGTAFVVPTVAASVDLVVHVGTDPDGRRRVREIVALPGRAEGGVIETADVFATRDGRLVRADGYPPHPERFAAAGFDLPGLLG